LILLGLIPLSVFESLSHSGNCNFPPQNLNPPTDPPFDIFTQNTSALPFLPYPSTGSFLPPQRFGPTSELSSPLDSNSILPHNFCYQAADWTPVFDLSGSGWQPRSDTELDSTFLSPPSSVYGEPHSLQFPTSGSGVYSRGEESQKSQVTVTQDFDIDNDMYMFEPNPTGRLSYDAMVVQPPVNQDFGYQDGQQGSSILPGPYHSSGYGSISYDDGSPSPPSPPFSAAGSPPPTPPFNVFSSMFDIPLEGSSINPLFQHDPQSSSSSQVAYSIVPIPDTIDTSCTYNTSDLSDLNANTVPNANFPVVQESSQSDSSLVQLESFCEITYNSKLQPRYKCLPCNLTREFARIGDLKRHLKRVHKVTFSNIKTRTCKLCGIEVTEHHLLRHQESKKCKSLRKHIEQMLVRNN
jgi:hypothetical protein